MKTFRMKADLRFTARDINEAFERLSEHFRKCRNGEETNLIHDGEITVEPALRFLRPVRDIIEDLWPMTTRYRKPKDERKEKDACEDFLKASIDGGKLGVIKAIRELTGMGLKESREYMEKVTA